MSKCTLVIYHRADYDGIFCREIAKKKFGDLADYVGWDYADPAPEIGPDYLDIYILDLSIEGLMDDPRVTWIDHHKSAIDKYYPGIKGYRIDGVAACRLAWQYFFGPMATGMARETRRIGRVPELVDFFNRDVEEPLAVRLAGEYDIWDKRDPRTDTFQCGLNSQQLGDGEWERLLDHVYSETEALCLLGQGRAIEFARNKSNASMIKEAAFEVDFEGFRFLAFNTTRCNSLTFDSIATAQLHDGCLAFGWVNGQWKVSMYGLAGKTDLDFSVIAVKYGGGGHRQACGFRTNFLPFLPPNV